MIPPLIADQLYYYYCHSKKAKNMITDNTCKYNLNDNKEQLLGVFP